MSSRVSCKCHENYKIFTINYNFTKLQNLKGFDRKR